MGTPWSRFLLREGLEGGQGARADRHTDISIPWLGPGLEVGTGEK